MVLNTQNRASLFFRYEVKILTKLHNFVAPGLRNVNIQCLGMFGSEYRPQLIQLIKL